MHATKSRLFWVATLVGLAACGPAAWAREGGQAAAPAGASGEGRGLVFGVGFGPGQLGFGGDAGRSVLLVGAATSTQSVCFYSTCTVTRFRSGRVAPRDSVVPGAERVVPFPASQGTGTFSTVFGWSFSNRLAVLLDADLALGWGEEGFENLAGGVVVRYSPARRFWVEAGPAFGQLSYRYDYETFEKGTTQSAAEVAGQGALAAAGFELLRHRTWRLDAQARVGALWFEGVRTTNLSVQLGWVRRRS